MYDQDEAEEAGTSTRSAAIPHDAAECLRLSPEEVRAAVAAANIPALLMVVFQMTGDPKWLEDPYRPTRGRGLDDHDTGGLPDSVQAEIRLAAVNAILRLQDGREPVINVPSPELAAQMMGVCMGEPVAARYGEMLATELARRIAPSAPDVAPEPITAPKRFRVIVIGAGVAGIAAVHQLEDMGLDYVVLEKQHEAGGNWWQNRYPGAGVDTPSHLYSFSFAKNDWAQHFELRDELQRYFARTLSKLAAQDRIRYDTEVLTAEYDATTATWEVTIQSPDGSIESLSADVLISAVGVLNRPKRPNLPGMGTFAGASFHTAEWPSDLDHNGKRVAVVGTGASSMQIVPAIADSVSELKVLQRSPQWVAPFEKFQRLIPPDLRKLLWACPLYHGWYWLRLFWQFGDKVIEALRIDPTWEHPERSVNARNDGHRQYFTRYITDRIGGDESLLRKVLPTYPPFGKRILLDNGWYDALLRENVELIDEAVTAVREDGLVTESGRFIEVDVVIWATGFDAVRFVSSMNVVGVDGKTLREVWDDDDPKAYLGISVPGFPNFFMLGGPNSFPGSGSFMYFMEVQMLYIRRLLTQMFRRGLSAVDATPAAYERYNQLVDEMNSRTVWTHPGMSTYYRNSRGRVVFVMPFLNVDYWEMTRRPNMADYTIRKPAVRGAA